MTEQPKFAPRRCFDDVPDDAKIYYSMATCWWTFRERELYCTDEGLPSDPLGNPLGKVSRAGEWKKLILANPHLYGGHRVVEAALHGNVTRQGKPVALVGWHHYANLVEVYKRRYEPVSATMTSLLERLDLFDAPWIYAAPIEGNAVDLKTSGIRPPSSGLISEDYFYTKVFSQHSVEKNPEFVLESIAEMAARFLGPGGSELVKIRSQEEFDRRQFT